MPDRNQLSIVIHPGSQTLHEEFFDNIIIDPAAVEHVDFVKLPSGGIIHISQDLVFGMVRITFPHGAMWNKEEVRFSPSTESLNEFGFLYVALFIAGNYARYYSDKWMQAVERSLPLALAIEELTEVALNRLPVLALTELSRSYHVSAR
jgi:hypothetical protein